VNGNIYKYETKNPLVRFVVNKFLNDIKTIILPIKNEIKNALDIGYGEGYITKFLWNLGINVEGADISPEALRIAREKFPEINFTQKSIYELTKYNTKYDIIFAIEILEHLSNPRLAIDEVIKCSNKFVFLSVPNEPFFRLANILRFKYLNNFGKTPGHINSWNYFSFRRLLRQSGLIIKNFKVSTLWLMALCTH
jgi:2-polyprenyl-3-methyl-5-hydroxy-6-metoxy-1,4-benzoquinol methylase